ATLALFRNGPRAQPRVAAVGLDLAVRGHFGSGYRIGFVSSFRGSRAAPPPPSRHCPLKFPLPPLGQPVSCAALSASEPAAWVLAQRVAATARGSIPWLSHQARS